ncbi:hypothetical protein PVAR5_4728 [Paecilomyces variotii No. 5]|uniref:Uncharacterized protein n=1 Tax=Byssochlamys spectabilis (strain No. 5 / NBRC 109023) TaxID=1356009 RepID=V5FF00_BYSSN|nr:hypothetical protein PVAR5_4728 [Paecilomyces variotii No. 5]
MNETTGRRHAAKKKEEGVEGEGEQGSSDNRRRCDDPTNVVFLCSRPTSARLGTIAATPKQSVEHAGRPRGSRRTAMEIANEANVQNGGAQEFRVLTRIEVQMKLLHAYLDLISGVPAALLRKKGILPAAQAREHSDTVDVASQQIIIGG